MATVFSSSRPLACWGGERGVKEKEQSEEEPWRNPPRVSRAPQRRWSKERCPERWQQRAGTASTPTTPATPFPCPQGAQQTPHAPSPRPPPTLGPPPRGRGTLGGSVGPTHLCSSGDGCRSSSPALLPRQHWGSRRPRPCVPPPYVPPSPRLSPVSHRVCLPRMAPAVTPGLCLPAASSGPTGRAAGS